MTATLAKGVPADDERWGYEFKWDGVRAIVCVSDGRLMVQSRNLLDVTPRYPELTGLVDALDGRSATLDGEVVALDDDGRPSFQRLQERMHVGSDVEVRRRMATTPVALLLFDVLEVDGRDTTGLPYTERRTVLDGLGLAGSAWQTPPWHAGGGPAMLAASAQQGLEGIMAKRLDSTYEVGRRSRDWLKIKNKQRQELVVGGWAEGEGNRENRIGALLVGYHDDAGDLVYAGNVGTGFTDKALRELADTLRPLARPSPPFSNPPRLKGLHWVEPTLVCEVEFTEWTNAGTLRHPSFKGLRDDKPASDVVRERARDIVRERAARES